MRLPDPDRSHAVLIGTARYHSDVLPDLPAVRNNLDGLADMLTDPARGGMRPDRCTVLVDPPDARRVYRALRLAAAMSVDTFLLYLAGQGLVGGCGELHLALAEPESLPFDTLRDLLADCPAANRVVIVDCCFRGRATQDITDQLTVAGAYVLAPAPVNAPAGTTYTSFTGALIALLRDGLPDGPPLLTYSTVYHHLRQAATTRGLPTPRQRGTDTVDLLALSRNPAVSRGG